MSTWEHKQIALVAARRVTVVKRIVVSHNKFPPLSDQRLRFFPVPLSTKRHVVLHNIIESDCHKHPTSLKMTWKNSKGLYITIGGQYGFKLQQNIDREMLLPVCLGVAGIGTSDYERKTRRINTVIFSPCPGLFIFPSLGLSFHCLEACCSSILLSCRYYLPDTQ